MTTSFVPSVVPRSTPTRRVGSGATGRSRPPLPVPALDRGCAAAADTVYVVSADPAAGVLVGYRFVVLDRLLADAHAAVVGGAATCASPLPSGRNWRPPG